MRYSFIEEIDDREDDLAIVLTGRWRATTDSGEEGEFASLDEAVTWAQARSDRVAVEIGTGSLRAGRDSRYGARLAEQAVAGAGFREVWMSADSLDAGLADIDGQTAGLEGEVGWTTGHALVYEISGVGADSTRHEVIGRAVTAVADAVERELGAPVWRHTTDEPMDSGWGVDARAWPVGGRPSRLGLWDN